MRISKLTPMPIRPAQRPMIKVSALNTWEMFPLEAPMARRIPISFCLSRTLIYVITPIIMDDTTSEMETKAMST